MKKIFLVFLSLLITLGVIGCDIFSGITNTTAENGVTSTGKYSSFTDIDLSSSWLGYGYDIVNSDYINSQDVKVDYPILNHDKLMDAKLLLIDETNSVSEYVSGNSMEEFSVEYAGMLNIYGSSNTSRTAKNKFSGGLKASFQRAKSSTQSVFFYTYMQKIEEYYLVLQEDNESIQNMLSDSFKEDIKYLDSNALFNKYGTHMLKSVTMGGRLEMNYTVRSSQKESFLTAEAAINTHVKYMGASINFEAEASYEDFISSSNREVSFYAVTKGGDAINTRSEADIIENYNSWVTSVKESPALSGIYNENSLLPVWELLPDGFEERAIELETAFNDMAESEYEALIEMYSLPTPIERIEITNEQTNVPVGSNIEIEFIVYPEDAVYDHVFFDVDGDGYIQGNKLYVYDDAQIGSNIIVTVTIGNISDTITMEVIPEITEIILSCDSEEVLPGDSILITNNLDIGESLEYTISLIIDEDSVIDDPIELQKYLQLNDGIIQTESHVPDGSVIKIYGEAYSFVSNEIEISVKANETSYDGFDGGNGSLEFPYLISTYDQLDMNMRQNLNVHYKLLNNILVPSSAWSDVYWTAFGDNGNGSYTEFTGSLDGGGFAIYGLTANDFVDVKDNKGYFGLFAKLGSGSIVKNLTVNVGYNLDGANTSNDHVIYVGGLAGYAYNSTIINVHINGWVGYNHKDQKGEIVVGGIVGRAESTTISRSSNEAWIKAIRWHNATGGGIAGSAYDCTFENVINTGDVTVETWQGTCIAGACTTIDTNAGGLVAYSINNSYSFAINRGKVVINRGQDKKQGSLIGYSEDDSLDDYVYYLEGTSSYSIYNSKDATRAKTLDEFKNISMYMFFDKEIWIVTSGTPAILNKELLD